MRKQAFIVGISVLSLALLAQEIQHESLVINVEVPVRVFSAGKFIDHLTIDDFEVYENGRLQRVEAVYLIRKKDIERKEEKKSFSPDTSRTFYLFFQITDYSPKIEDALHYFMQNVLVSGDSLVVVTPLKTYEMNPRALALRSKEEIVKELKEILRKDAMLGSSEYRSALTELTRIARALGSALPGTGEQRGRQDQFAAPEYEEMDPDTKVEMLLNLYKGVLEKLEGLRHFDQSKLLEFARVLKDKEGQKYVFLFYQREFIPQIEPGLLVQSLGTSQDATHVIQDVAGLFHSYRREITFDIDWVKEAYADASASIHFMFFTKPAEHVPGIRFEEHSEDIFAAFREMAVATGGITESSSNPFSLFRTAVESSETYYLLYYSPLDYRRDGQFKKVEIRVKNPDYKVIHRAGYFAN